jgi:hypothetical protein
MGDFFGLFRHMVGLFGQVISPSQRCLPTHDNTAQKYEDKHPCLTRDLNPRSRRQSDQGLASDRATTGTGSSEMLVEYVLYWTCNFYKSTCVFAFCFSFCVIMSSRQGNCKHLIGPAGVAQSV